MAEPTNESSTPDACPQWCSRRHTSRDHVEDRLHQSPPSHAVLVTAGPWPERDAPHHASPVVARLVQHAGSAATWLEVSSEEDGSVRLSLTPESGRRLVSLLELLLELTHP